MKDYRVYYHFSSADHYHHCDLRATDEYQAIAKVQKIYSKEPHFSIISVHCFNNPLFNGLKCYWLQMNPGSKKVKVFYKCSNCGHCVSEPTKECPHCGRSMAIWKEI